MTFSQMRLIKFYPFVQAVSEEKIFNESNIFKMYLKGALISGICLLCPRKSDLLENTAVGQSGHCNFLYHVLIIFQPPCALLGPLNTN